MALSEWNCTHCKDQVFIFDDELYSPEEGVEPYPGFACHCGSEYWNKMPPWVTVVHRTEIFMLVQFDSVHTIHDLDAVLQDEASEEREVREQNKARREL